MGDAIVPAERDGSAGVDVGELRLRLVRVAWAITGDLDTAEEATHDVLLACHDRLDLTADPWAYARTALLNRLRSQWRRTARERRALERLRARPKAVVEMPEPSASVWRAVQRLPMRQRMALVLVVLDDLPLSAVADELDCSAETARTHLRRAKQRLADELRSWEVAP